MGRVRTKTVKKAARVIIEKYYTKLTKDDFHHNKSVCDYAAIIPSKRLRNQIAGYITHLMKRIEKGPVRGICIELQEKERERRDNYMPDISFVDPQILDILSVDKDTKEMIDALNLEISNVEVIQAK